MSSDRKEIRKLLKKVRPTPRVATSTTSDQKVDKIAKHFEEIMKILGLDLKNDSLSETPKRVAKMYVKELFSGLDDDTFPKITTIENEMGYDQMIVARNVGIMSVCEHHFVTIDGRATIAYIPDKKVIGLSKINRIAKFFSRRPQVQERLTKQIADCLELLLETDNVAVHIEAKHYCLVSRGVEDTLSTTVTSDLRGDFKRLPQTRAEFMNHCQSEAKMF